MIIIFLLLLVLFIAFIVEESLRKEETDRLNREYYREYLIEYCQIFHYNHVSEFTTVPLYPSSEDSEKFIQVKVVETKREWNKTFKCSFYKEEDRKIHEKYLIEKYGEPDYISPVEISRKELISEQWYPWSRLGKENVNTTFRLAGYPTEIEFFRKGV